MPVRTQSTHRSTTRAGAHAESQCANCGWFTRLDATGSTESYRGTCHRYDYLSTEKTPLVHVDDWCFDHLPQRELERATEYNLLLPRSSH